MYQTFKQHSSRPNSKQDKQSCIQQDEQDPDLPISSSLVP